MKIGFDNNNLLVIDDPNIPQLKEYQHTLSGWKFSSYDKEIFVYHKRIWKVINLKNLGEGMQICYLKENKHPRSDLNIPMIARTLAMFSGFDEEKNEKYRFLPFFSKEVELLQENLDKNFGITCQISKERQGTFIHGLKEYRSAPESDEELLSHIFMLVFLYGKFEIKNNELIAAKAHIPLFSIRNTLEKLFTEYYIPHLQELGIFITSSLVQNGNKKIFQLNINDFELLELFAKWLNEYQKMKLTNPSSIYKKQTEIRNQLLDFLKMQEFENIEGLDKVIEKISTHTLKFLK